VACLQDKSTANTEVTARIDKKNFPWFVVEERKVVTGKKKRSKLDKPLRKLVSQDIAKTTRDMGCGLFGDIGRIEWTREKENEKGIRQGLNRKYTD
jgi:hypothetical protein